MSNSYPRLKRIKTVRSGKIRTSFGRGNYRRIKSESFIEFESDVMPIDYCLTPTEDIEWFLAHGHQTGEYLNDCLPVIISAPDVYTIPDIINPQPTDISKLVQTGQLTYQLFGEYTIRSATNFLKTSIAN